MTNIELRIQSYIFEETWMDLEIVILSEGHQTEKDKHHMTPLRGRISKMVQ